MSKPIVICGSSHKMDSVSKQRFIESMSNDGEYEVIFDESNIIPYIMQGLIIFTYNPSPYNPSSRQVDPSIWNGGEWIGGSLTQN